MNGSKRARVLPILLAVALSSCAGTPEPAAVCDAPGAWTEGSVVLTRFGAVRGREDVANT